MTLLKTSSAGAEFLFDFGLILRAGLQEINPADAASSLRLGAGYRWRGILGLDYAFSPHPLLGDSHRLALQFTPSFPRFQGRNFRSQIGKSPMRKSDLEMPGAVPTHGTGQAEEVVPASPPRPPEKEILEEE